MPEARARLFNAGVVMSNTNSFSPITMLRHRGSASGDSDTDSSMEEPQAAERAPLSLSLHAHPDTEASMADTQMIEDSQAPTLYAGSNTDASKLTAETQAIGDESQAPTARLYPTTAGSKDSNEIVQVPATPPLPRWRAVWKAPKPAEAAAPAPATPPPRDDIDQHPKKARKVTFCDPPSQKASIPPVLQGPLRRKKHRQTSTSTSTPKLPAQYPRDTTVTRAWGKLVTTDHAACHAYSTMYLLAAFTSIGRSRSCTYRFNYLTVSRVHIRIILAERDDLRPAENADPRRWRAQPSMRAWVNVEACNGCFVNGDKKTKGYIGRIYNGDYLQFSQPGGLFTYRCEFLIGDHQRPRALVNGGGKTLALYSPSERKRKREREEE
ncbi:hypothetical protein DFP73DRAFT_525082 [Morchella snyderi]|nr:hypothetical protein DFP73DRAFT_525082 [Morchella snyderi]